MTGNYGGFDVGYTAPEKLKYFKTAADGILLNDIAQLL